MELRKDLMIQLMALIVLLKCDEDVFTFISKNDLIIYTYTYLIIICVCLVVIN